MLPVLDKNILKLKQVLTAHFQPSVFLFLLVKNSWIWSGWNLAGQWRWSYNTTEAAAQLTSWWRSSGELVLHRASAWTHTISFQMLRCKTVNFSHSRDVSVSQSAPPTEVTRNDAYSFWWFLTFPVAPPWDWRFCFSEGKFLPRH